MPVQPNAYNNPQLLPSFYPYSTGRGNSSPLQILQNSPRTNSMAALTLGGTITAGNIVSLSLNLNNFKPYAGSNTIALSYTIKSTDTLVSVAEKLTALANKQPTLRTYEVSANVAELKSTTITVSAVPAVGTILYLQVASSNLASPINLNASYIVQTADTVDTIATGLTAAINAIPEAASYGVSAAASTDTIVLNVLSTEDLGLSVSQPLVLSIQTVTTPTVMTNSVVVNAVPLAGTLLTITVNGLIIEYVVQPTDTTVDLVAQNLSNAVNANPKAGLNNISSVYTAGTADFNIVSIGATAATIFPASFTNITSVTSTNNSTPILVNAANSIVGSILNISVTNSSGANLVSATYNVSDVYTPQAIAQTLAAMINQQGASTHNITASVSGATVIVNNITTDVVLVSPTANLSIGAFADASQTDQYILVSMVGPFGNFLSLAPSVSSSATITFANNNSASSNLIGGAGPIIPLASFSMNVRGVTIQLVANIPVNLDFSAVQALNQAGAAVY